MTLEQFSIVVIVLTAIGLFMFFRTKRENDKNESARGSAARTTTLAGEPVAHRSNFPAAVVEALNKDAEARKRFRALFESSAARCVDLESSFDEAFASSGGSLDLDDALDEVVDMGHKPEEVVKILSRRNHTLGNIAKFLSEHDVNDIDDIMRTLLPFTAAAGTPEVRARETLDAVCDHWDIEGDEEELMAPLRELGCTELEIAALIHRKTELSFVDVVRVAGLFDNPDTIAMLAKTLEVDLASDDPYDGLREEGLAFAKAAYVLRISGHSAEEALNSEYAYGGSDAGEIKECVAALSDAGFSTEETLIGLWESDVTSDMGEAESVAALHDAKIPLDEIVQLLVRKNVDPDDLFGDLHEADLDARSCVRITHALYEALDRKNAATPKDEEAAT